jgi:hypothetical protein
LDPNRHGKSGGGVVFCEGLKTVWKFDGNNFTGLPDLLGLEGFYEVD